MAMMNRFLFRTVVAAANRIKWTTSSSFNVLLSHHEIPVLTFKASAVTGISFTPISDAELKIQLYYKKQEIKKRKEKLKKIAQSIWNEKPDVDYAHITLEECKKMYEKHTGHIASPWEAKQIYIATLDQYAPWRYFQEEKERQQHARAMIEEIYNDLQNEIKKGKDLTLSKSDMTVLLEKKLGELPATEDVEDMWMERYRLRLVNWLEQSS